MKLLIGEKLKFYRRQKGLTQEEVAAHLGISYQAISKWERNDGYPDITMLPALANYFAVTVDELIGMNELAAREQYEEINRRWAENNEKAKMIARIEKEKTESAAADELHRQNVDLMRRALKSWPNDALLLVQLSTSLEKLQGTKVEKEANLRESILLQEQILRGEDSEVRSATLFNICYAYEKVGEHEKALAAAGKLPNLYKTQETARVLLNCGEEKRKAAKEALPPLTYLIPLYLSAIAGEGEEEWYREKAERICKILSEDIENPSGR